MDLDRMTTQVGDRYDELERTLRDRYDDLERGVRDRLSTDLFRPEPVIRTTWPRRLLWAAVGFAAGAAAAYLADPDRGSSRRTQLQQRVQSTGTDLASTAAQRADYAAGQAKGAAVEAAKAATPEDVPDDVKTLEARVKSEVFGRRDDVDKVVLRADGPGVVTVKGTVPTPVAERELLAQIAEVEGVRDVHSELSVAGTS